MRTTALALATLLTALPLDRLTAQATPLPAPGEKFTFHSNVLGEDREVWVHLPLEGGSGERYDVVYVLDGNITFPLATAVMEHRVVYGRGPRLVIVGITSVNTRGRGRDFTPVVDSTQREWFPETGKADRFLQFLETELIPAIATRYPVTRHRMIIGHSLAGLFALHALSARPDLFERYIAISPSIPWANEAILHSLGARLPTLTGDRSLFVSVANEEDGYIESTARLETLLRDKAPVSLRWRVARFPDDDHGSTVPPAVHRGFSFIFDQRS
jgi:predicted alpha/beta superfamily hydrolase